MTRELHEKDVCELSDASLEEEIREHMHGDGLAIVVEDERLTKLVPINGQHMLFGDALDFGDDVDVFTAPLPSQRKSESDPVPDEQMTFSSASRAPGNDTETSDSVRDKSRFPQNASERFHFESNSRDSLVTLFPITGYYQRSPSFLDMTRIVREGGSIVAVTGLQPLKDGFCDAKWWVPDSDDVKIDAIRILHYEEFKTPIVVSVFSVIASEEQHPDATIVSAD